MDHKRFEKGYLPLFLSYYKPHLNLFLLDMCCALGIAGGPGLSLCLPYALKSCFPKTSLGPFSPSWRYYCWPTACGRG